MNPFTRGLGPCWIAFVVACGSSSGSKSTDSGGSDSVAADTTHAGDSTAATGDSIAAETATDSVAHDSTSSTDFATDADATTFANPAPGSSFFIGTNFWEEDWEPTSDYFAASVDWATTTNPWNPALFTDLAPYAHVIRFMDWNRTNGQVAGDWASRAQPNVAPTSARGVAYEWQIDACNRAHTDCWINVPTLADDNHVTMLAQLIQQKLDPTLRIYVEYSNEVWNGGFPQGPYAVTQGVAANLPGTDQDHQGMAWYVQRSVQIYAGFEAVFGHNSPRLVKVLSGQAGYTGPATDPAPRCSWHLQMLANATVNPNGETIDAYAIAPYFSGTTTTALAADIPNQATYVTDHAACLAGTGIPLISYEGGQDSYSATSCQSVQTDPGMTNLYETFLTSMKTAGMVGPFNQYTHVGSCWGLKVATGDASSAAPKYEGVLDWLAANP